MRFIFLAALLVSLLPVLPARAQEQLTADAGRVGGLYREAPRPFRILDLTVEGAEDEGTRTFVLQSSGLTIGQEVLLPGDPSLAQAIRSIYDLRLFSDVKIIEDRRVGEGVYLTIRVTEEPRLVDYTFSGVKKSHREDLQKTVPLLKGARVRPADLARSEQAIKAFYEEKGYLLAEVDTRRSVTENGLELEFVVDRGEKVEVADIVVRGNEQLSDRSVRKQLKETKPDAWWRFWSTPAFQPDEYEEDLDRVLQYYNEKGFYDARIVSDTVYLSQNSGDPAVTVELTVHEGPRYHIRDITWEGNTLYPDEVLTDAIGLEEGDVYNNQKLEENLFGNRRSTDVASLYMNQGYMRFNVQPEVQIVEGDSLDLVFDVYEGNVYEFGDIKITGNTKTKDHVIRRELYTVPGQTFSRESIQETIRRLAQLNYFEQTKLGTGPNINIDEANKEVDLIYDLEEVGSDQLELSGTYGRFGVVLQLRFNFNNFSIQDAFNKEAWRPLPSGDGQKLSLSVQASGTAFQSYSLGFTEPWFRGRPSPVGFNATHTRINRNPFLSSAARDTTDSRFTRSSLNTFYQRRLKWPDDNFTGSLGVGYQHYNNGGYYSNSVLPLGVSQEVTLRQSISRNSLNHPLFPTNGSTVGLSLDVAVPLPGFIQYHKWRFNSQWNVPLADKLTLALGTDFGYIGTLTGDDVQFERFLVGGSPFDTQGFSGSFIGKDVVYMRGYPARALGPRRGEDPVGGRILNKYTGELRWLAVQSAQLQAAPYLFLDAANTWDSFETYNPAQLFRSAGAGVRLFLPILGVIELTYGYNLDSFDPINNSHDGSRRWLFQFSLGQGF